MLQLHAPCLQLATLAEILGAKMFSTSYGDQNGCGL